MTISYWLDEPGKNTRTFDAVIVGAGIAGLSTAYWLEKKDPSLKIALVDKHDLGYGASGRNAGFVTCGSANHFKKLQKNFGFDKAIQIWNFSEENRKLLLSEIIQDRANEVDFYQTGSCTVASSDDDWDQQQKILSKDMLKAGIDVELIQKSELISEYGVQNFEGGIRYKHDGIIHPVKLLRQIKSKLKSTTFLFGEEVFKVLEDPSSVIIETQKNRLVAKKLFVCLNGYVSQLLPEFKDHIKPQRSQAILTEPLPPFVKGPCYLTKHLCYFRQLPMGELLVGGFRNHDLEAENTALDEATSRIQEALTEFTSTYFKQARGAKIKYRWSGIMGFSKDEQMLVGQHPERPNVFVMAGCASHGMGLSFNVGRVLVDSSYGIRPPDYLDIGRVF